MAKNNVEKCLVIGGSAGALKVILDALHAIKTTVPIIIVLHRKENHDGTLEALFAARTSLKVKEAEDKDILMPGSIFIAPASYHLLVERDATLSLDASEKINYSRPSIDATFQTAGEAFGNNLLAILLSGANSDGTDGLQTIKAYGGLVAVQDPLAAQVSIMPIAAIGAVAVDYIFANEELAAIINQFGK